MASSNPEQSSGALAVAYTATPGVITGLDDSQLPGMARYLLRSNQDCWWSQGIADTVVTAAFATDTFTSAAAHKLTTGMALQMTAGTTLPTGIAAATTYWVIATGQKTFKLATSRANALAGTAIDIADNGVGTLTVKTVAVAGTGNGSAFLPAKAAARIDGAFGTNISVIQDAVGGKASVTPGDV